MKQNNATTQNEQITTNTGEIILYQLDNSIRLDVRMEEETVWLTQAQMALLFGCSQDNVGLHLAQGSQEELFLSITCPTAEE